MLSSCFWFITDLYLIKIENKMVDLSLVNSSDYLEWCNSITITCLIFILFVILSRLFFYAGGKRRKFVEKLEQFPGPRAYPLIGNLLDLIFPPDEIFDWLSKVSTKWGGISRFWVFGTPKVFINSYDIAMELLTRKTFLEKSEEFKPLFPVGKCSLVCATAQTYNSKRKALAPGYSRQRAESYFPIFRKHCDQLQSDLVHLADKNVTFNVMEYMGLCSFRIACETAFGPEIMMGLSETDYQEQINAWLVVFIRLLHRSFQPWFKHDFLYNLTQNGREVNRCFRIINGFGERAITQRAIHRKYESSSGKPECFLDFLMDQERKGELTKEDVLHELNVFIVAGYDSTATTAAWTLHLLASYPDVQEKLIKSELQQVAHIPDMSATNWKDMKYLDACINEALRLYPVIPWLLRRTNEDIVLKDGRTIPCGVDVPINIFSIHRDPKYFPEPDKFSPERLLRHDKNNSKTSLLSFGGGYRVCPGMIFGMLELKIMLSKLLLAYSWKSMDDPRHIKSLFHGVLVPAKGINVQITKRKFASNH